MVREWGRFSMGQRADPKWGGGSDGEGAVHILTLLTDLAADRNYGWSCLRYREELLEEIFYWLLLLLKDDDAVA